jgi:hypothetical protein
LQQWGKSFYALSELCYGLYIAIGDKNRANLAKKLAKNNGRSYIKNALLENYLQGFPRNKLFVEIYKCIRYFNDLEGYFQIGRVIGQILLPIYITKTIRQYIFKYEIS